MDAEGAYLSCLQTASESTCAAYLRLATLEAAVYDAAHPPSGPALAWIWADFRVDTQEPLLYGIQSPERLISAGSNTVRGYAYDDTGVPTVTLEIQRPSGGSHIVTCPDAPPMDGRWSCVWDVTASNGTMVPSDGDSFAVRLGTVDGMGQVAVLSTTQSFIVDRAPPLVTLDAEASDVISSGTLRRDSRVTLAGDIVDDGDLGTVEVCVDDACELADMVLDPGRVTRAYDDVPDPPLAIGATTPCGGGEVVRSFVVTESFEVGAVGVGFNAQHNHRDDLQVTLTSPSGTQVRLLFSDGISETHDAHYDVWLNDAAADAYSARGNDNPAVSYYDRAARPYAPLQALYGEQALGTWTLSMCDMHPSEDDGRYQRAQLVLKPRDTAAHTGHWRYTVVGVDEADSVAQSIAIYAEDLVGNRVAEPLQLRVTLDNVGPEVTVLATKERLPLSTHSPVVTGTATDGGGVGDVFVIVQTPGSSVHTERLDSVMPSHDGALGASQAHAPVHAPVHWTYSLEPNQVGTYTLWINAVDVAGNSTTTDPLEVVAAPAYEPSHLYLPLIIRSDIPAPELLLADGDLSATGAELVVANTGQTSVMHGFRVDMYFNPDPVPSGPNETWQDVAPYGGYWRVAGAALPLRPGALITLTLNDAYYQATGSHYPPRWQEVTSYYVQVDTLDEVVEIQEITNPYYYDNISGEKFGAETGLGHTSR